MVVSQLPPQLNSFTAYINNIVLIAGVLKVARPRKNPITRYETNDKGNFNIPRKDIEAEIPTIITKGGFAYAGKEFQDGKKVIILVLRD